MAGKIFFKVSCDTLIFLFHFLRERFPHPRFRLRLKEYFYILATKRKKKKIDTIILASTLMDISFR